MNSVAAAQNNSTLSSSLVGSFYGSAKVTLTQGVSDLACCVWLVILAFGSDKFINKRVAKMDTARQTAQDYSIVVVNPLPEHNIQSYKDHFAQFGEIMMITMISTGCGRVLKSLAKHDKAKRESEYLRLRMAEKGRGDEVNDSASDTFKQKMGLGLDQGYWKRHLDKSEEELKWNLGASEEPAKVYIAFNTERAQRDCLHYYSRGRIGRFCSQMMGGDIDNRIVMEAPEPSDIIWEGTGTSSWNIFKGQFYSYLGAGFILLISVLVLYSIGSTNSSPPAPVPGLFNSSVPPNPPPAAKAINSFIATASAVFVACLNSSLPMIMKMFCAHEVHISKSQQQVSMLNKLMFVRMANTGLIIFFVARNSEILSLTTLKKVQNILIADLVTTNVLRLMDPYTWIMRYYFGKSAITQAKLNSYWNGAAWNLGERYTDIMKTIFVSLSFLQILPTGIWITGSCLAITYWIDKFLLLRHWKVPPAYDERVGKAARRFLIVMVFWHLLITRWMYLRWPFNEPWVLLEGRSKSILTQEPSNIQDPRCPSGTCVTWLDYAKVAYSVGSPPKRFFSKLLPGYSPPPKYNYHSAL